MQVERPQVVELCCGYGGATAGMLAAGLTFEATYDLWPVAVEQHRRWHPEVPCEVRDVATITPDELAGRLVWASLPCQPWSRANQYAHMRGERHPHYYSLAHLARQVQHARCTIVENVPGLVEMPDGQAEMGGVDRKSADARRGNIAALVTVLALLSFAQGGVRAFDLHFDASYPPFQTVASAERSRSPAHSAHVRAQLREEPHADK